MQWRGLHKKDCIYHHQMTYQPGQIAQTMLLKCNAKLARAGNTLLEIFRGIFYWLAISLCENQEKLFLDYAIYLKFELI